MASCLSFITFGSIAVGSIVLKHCLSAVHFFASISHGKELESYESDEDLCFISVIPLLLAHIRFFVEALGYCLIVFRLVASGAADDMY